MIAHFLLRHSGWALLLSAAGLAACSGDNPQPADTFVNAAVGGGSKCSTSPSLKELVQIGTATSGHPNTVQDGGQDRNSNVSVSCTVHPQGSGFDVQLSAISAVNGTLTINSPQGKGIVTTMPSTGVSASFSGPAGSFREEPGNGDPGCTITYEYDQGGSVGGVAGDATVPVMPPIAGGRIWGHIHCPNAAYVPQPQVFCDAEADFIFEQCNQ